MEGEGERARLVGVKIIRSGLGSMGCEGGEGERERFRGMMCLRSSLSIGVLDDE